MFRSVYHGEEPRTLRRIERQCIIIIVVTIVYYSSILSPPILSHSATCYYILRSNPTKRRALGGTIQVRDLIY